MKTEDIIAKYPKIFVDYEGNPGRVNWHDVPDGWLGVIDDLCGSIQDYIDHTSRSLDNPNYVEGSTYNREDPTTWKYLQKHPEQVTCIQMKQKFGGLRFYEKGGDDQVYGMIRVAEYLCDRTCEDCGTREDLGVTSGWISTLCRNCAISHGDRAMNNWKAKK